MNLVQRVSAWYFKDEPEPTRETFAATPILNAIEAEQYGTELLPIVTRDEALSVPGVMRARNTICSIAALPLKTYDKDWKEVDNPLFRQIDPTRTNIATLADTFEDLLFYKYAYWRILERGFDNYPTSAEYVAYHRVSEQEENGRITIRIDGKLVPWTDIRKFEAPNPGFLKHGGRVVKRALDLDTTAAKFANNPRPLDYFTPDLDVDPLDDGGIRVFLRKWRNWLRYNVTGYVPAGMKYVSVEQPTPAELQLIEAQKQVGLSIANMTGLDPEDLGINVTSRTYFNADQRRQEKINDVLNPYMRAVTDRLSMGDTTKRGYQVLFDISDYMRADAKTRAETQLAYHAAGLLTDDEIREDERRPALPPRQQAIKAPREVESGETRV